MRSRNLLTVSLTIKEQFPFVSFIDIVIILESALMKYRFHTEEFIEKIVRGKIEDLETEQLDIFTKLTPKP